MKVKVIGKSHLKGVSKKTNQPYDFLQVHYNGPSRGVEGLAALTQALDPQQYDFASIKVGGTYDIQFDNRGYVVSFDLIG